MSLPPNPRPAGGQEGIVGSDFAWLKKARFCKSCFPNGKVALSRCEACQKLCEVVFDGWGKPEALVCGHGVTSEILQWPCPSCGSKDKLQ